ncbi:MAG: DUF4065 domain-containing protein [Chloroflexi bacterium]|nr:DUF4065 domain-containing protein [Chloroflexota bacterium]
MVHDPKTAANELIQRGIGEGQPLTHIEVQKLLYFWHGWMLGIHDQPLHTGFWEAWRYGPVLPEVYFSLNHHRGRPITGPIPARDEMFTEDEKSIMDVVYDYRLLGTFTLVGITHTRGGPWDQVWHGRKNSSVIGDELIRSYFAGLLSGNSTSDG